MGWPDLGDEYREAIGVHLKMVMEGDPLTFMTVEFVRMAVRFDIISRNLQWSDGSGLVHEEIHGLADDSTLLLATTAEYLLKLNEVGARTFARLGEDRKIEARRILQLCLDAIDK